MTKMTDPVLEKWIMDTGVSVLLEKAEKYLDQEDATARTATRALFSDLMDGPIGRDGLAALLSYITIGALTKEDDPDG